MGQNWVTLLFFLVAFGGPVISWIFQKLKEQADTKRERALRQRQLEEELRTGRRSQDPAPAKLQSRKTDRATELQRLAERRQQQLQELRQRQAQQQSGQQAAVAAGAAQQASSPPQNLPSRAQTRAEQARQRLQERMQQRQAELRKRQEAQQQRRQQQSGSTASGRPTSQQQSGDAVDIQAALRRSAEASALDQVSIQKQLRDAPVSRTESTRPSMSRRKGNIGREVRELLRGSRDASIRRPNVSALIAVSEVLAKPVSMRDTDDGGGVTL